MAIHIEPIQVDNVSSFTFDKYASNLTQNDIQYMHDSARRAYEQYGDSSSRIKDMVHSHIATYSTDDALARAKTLMETIEVTQLSNEVMYLEKNDMSKPNVVMQQYITSHVEVSKRLDNKTMSPFSQPLQKEHVKNIKYKEATNGISTSKHSMTILKTSRPDLDSKTKITINRTYRNLTKHIDDIDFE